MLFALFLLLTGCQDDTFECGGKDLATVPADAVCDGVVDCWSAQDERVEGCETELFYCEITPEQVILAELVCDGVEDCGDATDEADCPMGS